MFKFLHKFTVFFVFFSAFIISDALAAGYSCPTYKRYTSCSYGYYMTSSSSSTTCNTTPTAGNACRPCTAYGSGYSCPGGTDCPKKIITCSAGYYLPSKTTSCSRCTANYYCPGGTYVQSDSIDQGRTACPKGFPTSAAGATSKNRCYFNIPAGTEAFWSSESYAPTTYPCSEKYYCKAFKYYPTSSESSYKIACPTRYPLSASGSDSKQDCYVTIPALGYIKGTVTGNELDDGVFPFTPCSSVINSYCPGGKLYYGTTGENIGLESCPTNYPYSAASSDAITDCYASVQAGYYMSSSGKKICPVGTYKDSHNVYYNNTSTCSNCSSGWTDGGPGSTSPEDCRKNIPAGSWFNGYSVQLCPSGEYSEAHYVTMSSSSPSSGCSVCPDYAPFSPTGAEGVAACGRLLHIGDSTLYLRSGKKTIPSLNILIDGKQFYGNLSTSITSQFKIKSGSTTYSLYDDTMD